MDFGKYAMLLQVMGAVAIGLPALLSSLIVFFMLVPGEQPEKFLQAAKDKLDPIIDAISKFSRK